MPTGQLAQHMRTQAPRAVRHLPVVAMVLLFVVTGIRGVDFGQHWDELPWQVQPVREMVASGLLVPRASIYPTLAKWLILLPSVPAGVRTALHRGSSPRQAQAAMLAVIDSPTYLLTVRCLFIVVSSLAILWVYGAVLALRRPWWEALIAAAGLGLSWEYAYHSRWVATDCLVVQFSALTLFFLTLFLRTSRRGWLFGAAVAAGLGTGAKFPGVILVAPVLLIGVLTLEHKGWKARLGRVVALGATAAGAYLVSTPATLVDPFSFAEQLSWISDHYKQGHFMHSVASSWQHWRIALTYLTLIYFSPFKVAAALLFVSALAGAVLWIRDEPRVGALLIGFPLAFLAFFCFRYKAVIVRNYLLVVPFLCVLMARAIAEAFDRLPAKWMRYVLTTVLVALAIAQGIWLVRAAESIRHVDANTEVRDALGYVAQHPKVRFRLSQRVRELATAQHLISPSNAVGERASADAVVFFSTAEGPGSFRWKVNDPWLTMAIFGPREVNFNWYSGWWGHDRVVIMTMAKARATGASIAR